MYSKKIISVLSAVILICCTAACNRLGGVSSLPGGTPNTAGAGTELGNNSSPNSLPEMSLYESRVELDNQSGRHEFSDDNVSVDLALDRESYTVNDVIGLSVTITNKADTPIVFVKGSGSNRVPEGLNVTFGSFTAMYMPSITTLDYNLETIEPGQSMTYELPFAPYTLIGEEHLGGPGLDQNIEYFRGSELYAPHETGEIEGTFTFTYIVAEGAELEGNYPDLAEGGDNHQLTGRFTTRLDEMR